MSSPEYLRSLATHFARGEWEYTRNLDGMRHIRYARDYQGYDHPWRRVKRLFSRAPKALRGLFNDTPLWKRPRDWWPELRAHVIVTLRTDKNLPDGRLGAVVTFWEEDGEYIQMMQPSVGVLLADFLTAEPDHPHAKIITAELDRLIEGYDRRAKAGQVDGRVRT